MLQARLDELIIQVSDIRNMKDSKYGFSSPLNKVIETLSEKVTSLESAGSGGGGGQTKGGHNNTSAA